MIHTNKIILLAILLLVIMIPISQYHKKSLVEHGNIEIEPVGKPQVTVSHVSMRIGDQISVTVDQLAGRDYLRINLVWFGKTVTSSQPAINPTLSWMSNGNSTYTIQLEPVNSNAFQNVTLLIEYEVTRGIYYFPWLFPLVLISSIFFAFLGMTKFERRSKANNALASYIKTPYKILKDCDELMLLLLVLFVVNSLLRAGGMLHNDELGLGKSDGWGYFGWGYADTANQIASLLRNLNFSYEAWQTVHNMGKPILTNYFMAFFELLMPSAGPVVAGRLLVKLLGAFAAVAIYYLGRIMFNRVVGLLASFFLYFTPVFQQYLDSVYLDIPEVFFSILFLIFLYKKSQHFNYKDMLVGGILLGLLISSKSALLLYPFALISLIWMLQPLDRSTRNVLKTFLLVIGMCLVAVAVLLIHWPLMWTDPLNRLNYVGIFLGIFGGFGFPSPSPTLILGKVVENPSPMMLFFTYLAFQTTYVEIVSFLSFLLISLTKRNQKNCKILLLTFSIGFLASMQMPGYQHEVIWLFPFWALAVAVGCYGFFVYLERILYGMITKARSPHKKNLIFLVFCSSIVIGSQILLVSQAAPYYGLYYNRAFLLGLAPQNVFSLPEPVYGLDQIAAYLRENSTSNTVMTMTAPHTLQVYLPNYKVIAGYNIQWGDDTQNLQILKALGVKYVVIGEATLQTLPQNYALLNTLHDHAELVFIAQGDGIPLAYLYEFPTSFSGG